MEKLPTGGSVNIKSPATADFKPGKGAGGATRKMTSKRKMSSKRKM